MLGALSGCEKEKSATEPVYNPISRLDAEVLLKQWNAERKGRLKSATTLNLTEEQWGRAKVYQNLDEAISTISIPLSKWKVLCFGKNREGAGVYFCEVRPDDHYLELNGGRINKSTYTGYLVFFNDKGKGIAAYCYVDGRFKGVYEVATQQSFFKDITKEVFNLEEVVVVANRESPWKWIHDGNKGWTLNLCMPDYTFEERGGGYSNGTSNPDPEPAVVPKIDDKKLADNPCAKLAWELLKTNGSLSSMIQKFAPINSFRDISFDIVSNLYSDDGQKKADGKTIPIGDGYLIELDLDFVSKASTLQIARLLVHEIIHAELFYYYDLSGSKEEFKRRYPELNARWEAYGYENRNLFQHEEIGNQYRSQMVSILKDICPGYSDDVYNAVVWDGLGKTFEWKNLSLSEKERIVSIINQQNVSGNCSNN